MTWHSPGFLALLLLLLPLWLFLRRNVQSSVCYTVADSRLLHNLPETLISRAARLLVYWQLPVAALLTVALARPQLVIRESTVQTRGADIVVALDLSSSMLAEDANGKNRLNAAKEALGSFIVKRSGDRIGLVVFAARAYQAAPLTFDHEWLQSAVKRLDIGTVEDGTAIGDAVLIGLRLLQNSKDNSRAMIVLTDGRSNTGATPYKAAAAAAALGVKLHFIGIGSKGSALFPVADPLGGVTYRSLKADLDEVMLKQLAAVSGGSYFKAGDQAGLTAVLSEIDRLEKQPVERKFFFQTSELFHLPMLAALFIMAAVLLLHSTFRMGGAK